jgi:hypothetical protein
MPHRTTAVLSAATCVAALWLSGCSTESKPASAPPPPASSAPPSAVAPAPLPDPAALTDVLVRLSDPAIAGADKVALVQGATADEAASLDGFAKALADNHMLPLTFSATDLAWSDHNPGNVRATVAIVTAQPDGGTFTFPMEFTPAPPGWQLARETADQWLAFGTGPSASPAAPTTPTPTP